MTLTRRMFIRVGCTAGAAALWAPRRAAAEAPAAAERPDDFFAVPPYLQHVAEDAASILCETRAPARLRVEYGPTEALGGVAEHIEHGLRAATGVTLHRIRLAGLPPGKPCHYRVVAEPMMKFHPYGCTFGPPVQTPGRAFRTLDPAADRVTALLFNDMHDRFENLAAWIAAAGLPPWDFAAGIGDIFQDPPSPEHVGGILKGLTETLDGGARPVVYIRGNHETRGAYAPRMMERFAYPGSRFYHAFTAGPVRFVVLDVGEDKDDAHPAYSGLAAYSAYRAEQADWLRRETASDPFRMARFRVVLMHIPFYCRPERDPAASVPDARKQWLPILENAGIDLAVSGHTHGWNFVPAGTFPQQPFPLAIGGGPNPAQGTIGLLEADRGALRWTLRNSEGRVLHRFETAARG